ncbi:Guanine nucleotide-binding protein alpha-4 subunit [Psilocybe cubensis]|uniref:G-alpha-domain-containing protein n=2 Tax=Psilocybe cubensis TaxID=181762 RepID=A0A8H7XQC9_PSICU|nr:Guanine nucleotide-binding protein alpha-4 subunit [Psilocybe cubensis]KAH9477521.1 Guanine nucleotide-binding protein alpha-4 subunit [Psilocybe cubensis]
MPVPSEDPLDEVLKPPPDETPEQRELRLEREAEAKRVSLAIDANIKAERQALRKKRIVRLLLLGQSESGKSTTLRQFQRLYTPTAFREERILWRAVIQLNIVRSIRIILDALSGPMPNSPYSSPRARNRSLSRGRAPPLPSNYSPPFPPQSHAPDNMDQMDYPRRNGHGHDMNFSYVNHPLYPPRQPQRHQIPPTHHYNDPDLDDDLDDSDTDFAVGNNSYPSSPPNFNGSPRSHPSGSSTTTLAQSPLEALKARLLPLRHIEALLIAKLVPPNEEEATHLAGPSHYQNGQPSPTDSQFSHHTLHHNGRPYRHQRSQSYRNQEIFVRPGPGWKGGLARARVNFPDYSDASSQSSSNGQRPMSAGNTGLESPDEPQEVLHSCKRDMIQLWNDEAVRDVLRRRKIRLEDASGFFLDDLERVTALRYMPTDDDVLKARLKTVGVSEYKFEMEISAGRESGTEWRIVDVGGSRSQRPTWAPFFDDVDAIIFLAPISGFDQVLAEDRTVNRLEDSVLLWKDVCSSKILANVDLVLFLNKCDILEKKLNSGIKLAKYVRSYGDRPNDLDSVSKYLRGKFSAIHREYSPNPRKFYAFCTSVTDTVTTAGIIASVRDMVIRQHLKQSKLL